MRNPLLSRATGVGLLFVIGLGAFALLQRSRARPQARVVEPVRSGQLHEAAAGGREQRVRDLIGAGAEINETDVDGKTPLHVAQGAGVAAALIEAGAALDIEDATGTSAMWAVLRSAYVTDDLRQLLRKKRRSGVPPAQLQQPDNLLCAPGCKSAAEAAALLLPAAGTVSPLRGVQAEVAWVSLATSSAEPTPPRVAVSCCLFESPRDGRWGPVFSRALANSAVGADDLAGRARLLTELTRQTVGRPLVELPKGCRIQGAFQKPSLESDASGRLRLDYVARDGSGLQFQRVSVRTTPSGQVTVDVRSTVGACEHAVPRCTAGTVVASLVQRDTSPAAEYMRGELLAAGFSDLGSQASDPVDIEFWMSAEGLVSKITVSSSSKVALANCVVDVVRSFWMPPLAYGAGTAHGQIHLAQAMLQ